MKLKILGLPLSSTRVDDEETEMDTLEPPQPVAAVMERKKSRVIMKANQALNCSILYSLTGRSGSDGNQLVSQS